MKNNKQNWHGSSSFVAVFVDGELIFRGSSECFQTIRRFNTVTISPYLPLIFSSVVKFSVRIRTYRQLFITLSSLTSCCTRWLDLHSQRGNDCLSTRKQHKHGKQPHFRGIKVKYLLECGTWAYRFYFYFCWNPTCFGGWSPEFHGNWQSPSGARTAQIRPSLPLFVFCQRKNL